MKNCALIDELRISLEKGLNILTGETGSGKSIIIDALGLCLGNKYDKSFLRRGTEKGVVEAVFYSEGDRLKSVLDENEIEYDDGNIVITRIIYRDGKSTARVNGRTIRLSLLKEIASLLVDVHGQHSNQAIFRPETHLRFVDMSGDVEKEKSEYTDVYKKYTEVRRELLKLDDNKDEMEIQREIDLLKFQINEIEAASLKEGEYDELVAKRDIFRNSEKIYNSLSAAYGVLHEGDINTIDLAGRAVAEISSVSQYSEKISSIYERAERIMYELQDISSEIRNCREETEFEPYELEQLETRVDEINNLRRKYGNTEKDIFLYYDRISERLSEILNRDEKREELKGKLQEIESVLEKKAEALTEKRKTAAENLENELIKELNSLDMKNVTMKTVFERKQYSNDGADNVEFMISFNLGEELKPISKVASGGEISRFMLAFKSIIADADDIETLVFDEIDTGISGIAAQNVGEKLSDIADKKQIICITHLPQIAANADSHYLIEKRNDEQRTYTTIEKLDEPDRINEIARLISGKNITDTTIIHAREIIQLTSNRREC
ncbi:DNA repair protein RecN [Peptacetobacter hominis]|uniref:DNA repair protein RecN n=2 Tax=Peptacetobacter hominis TaxID=2743610 RepID=A0A544QVI6_9FIRM|nr:DNA repair protein RecN [Peptacetobacter hominis]